MGRGHISKFVGALSLVVVAAAFLATNSRADDLPTGYAVMPFENRSQIGSMEWMRVAIPFELAEKLEAHPQLRALYGTLVLVDGRPPATIDADSVAAFAAASGAELVWTGWTERASNWDLTVGFQLWRVIDGAAESVGEVDQRGDFKDVHVMTNEALKELCAAAEIPIAAPFAEEVLRIPTEDHYAFTLFGRGLLWMHGLGKRPHLSNARKNLEKALFIDPKLAEAHRLMAVVHLWKKKPAKARGQLGFALDLRPSYYAALAGQGRVLYEAGKVQAAQELFEKMLVLRPWDMELRFELGKLFWENGDADASLAELERVVDANPEHLPARRVLVLVHASRGDGADLVKQLEAVAELDPDDLATKLDLGAAYAAVDRYEDAVATYEAIIADNPKHLQALKFTGDLYRRRGELDKAIGFYTRALHANSSDPRPYFLLGQAYVDAGDDKKARRVYQRAQKFKRYLPETYNNLGSIAYRQRRYGEARWYVKRAVRYRPSNPRFRYNMALIYSVLRDLPGAIEQLEAGLEKAPDDVALLYLRGVVMLRTGDADTAKASFERVLELDEDHEDARHNLSLLEQMHRRAVDGEITVELPQPAQ